MKCKIYLGDYNTLSDIEILRIEGNNAFIKVLDGEKKCYVKCIDKDDYHFFIDRNELLRIDTETLDIILNKTSIVGYGYFPKLDEMSEELIKYLVKTMEKIHEKGYLDLFLFIRIVLDR